MRRNKMLNRNEALKDLISIRENILSQLRVPPKTIPADEYLNISLILNMLQRIIEVSFETDQVVKSTLRYVIAKSDKEKTPQDPQIRIELNNEKKDTKKEKKFTADIVANQAQSSPEGEYYEYKPSDEDVITLISAFINQAKKGPESLYGLFLDYKNRERKSSMQGDVDLDLLRLLLREFNDIIQQKCITPLPFEKQNYFEVFCQLVRVTKYGELTDKSRLSDPNSFPFVSSLLKMQGLEPGDDFLIAYKDIRPEYLLLFISFVTFHKSLLDEIFPDPVLGKRGASRSTKFYFDEMMKFIYLEHRHSKSIKTEDDVIALATNLLNKASPETWLQIIMAIDIKLVELAIVQSEIFLKLFIDKVVICKQHGSNLTVVNQSINLLKNIFIKAIELNDDKAKNIAVQLLDTFRNIGDQSNDPIFYQAYLKLLAKKEYELAEKIEYFMDDIADPALGKKREDELNRSISNYEDYIASLATRGEPQSLDKGEIKQDAPKQDEDKKAKDNPADQQQLAAFYSAVTNYAQMLLTPKKDVPPLIQALQEGKSETSVAAFEWLLNQRQIVIDAQFNGETALDIVKRNKDKEKGDLILQFKLKQIYPVFNEAEANCETFLESKPMIRQHLGEIKSAIKTLLSTEKLEGESISAAITTVQDQCTQLLTGLGATGPKKRTGPLFNSAAPQENLIESVKQISSIAQDLFQLQKMVVNVNIIAKS